MAARRILIVDDNPDVRAALSELLRSWKHEVLEAADGEMALLVATRNRPDVILLDLELPDMDGHEVARRLRAAPGGDHWFLIGVTGYSREEAFEQMVANGFDEHLSKPCDLDYLEELLISPPRSARRLQSS